MTPTYDAVRTETRVYVHQTPEAIYRELERVFGSKGEQATRWVGITADNGVELTFFEPTGLKQAGDVVAEPELDEQRRLGVS